MTVLYNIFLDFLNRDSRQIYGVHKNLSPKAHTEILNEAINVAVFLCGQFCLVPPGFLAEDEIVRHALSRCEEFLTERFILLAMREADWDSFFEKKQREYEPYRELYRGLFNPESQALLRKQSLSIKQRSSHVVKEIIQQWEEGPDTKGT